MDTRQKHISFTTAFKAAVDLTIAGVAKPETSDLGAELAELAKMLYLPPTRLSFTHHT